MGTTFSKPEPTTTDATERAFKAPEHSEGMKGALNEWLNAPKEQSGLHSDASSSGALESMGLSEFKISHGTDIPNEKVAHATSGSEKEKEAHASSEPSNEKEGPDNPVLKKENDGSIPAKEKEGPDNSVLRKDKEAPEGARPSNEKEAPDNAVLKKENGAQEVPPSGGKETQGGAAPEAGSKENERSIDSSKTAEAKPFSAYEQMQLNELAKSESTAPSINNNVLKWTGNADASKAGAAKLSAEKGGDYDWVSANPPNSVTYDNSKQEITVNVAPRAKSN